ncbi:MAG: hypothetical protein LUE65_01240 [Clostridiales bacterium]|nr:hypothetical protein [Clostridiales bacterium]
MGDIWFVLIFLAVFVIDANPWIIGVVIMCIFGFIIYACLINQNKSEVNTDIIQRGEKKLKKADVQNDPMIDEVIQFLDSFAEYDKYRRNSKSEPEEKLVYYTVKEDGSFRSLLLKKSLSETVTIDFRINNGSLSVRFSIDGYVNIFNEFCNTIGQSSYIIDKALGMIWWNSDAKVKKFWCDAEMETWYVNSDDGAVSVCLNGLVKTFCLQYKNGDEAYIETILDRAKRNFPTICVEKDKKGSGGKLYFPVT